MVFAGWLAAKLASPAIAWYDGKGDKIPGLERAVKLDPHNAELHIRLGHAYANRVPADAKRASEQYGEAVRLRPTPAKCPPRCGNLLPSIRVKSQRGGGC